MPSQNNWTKVPSTPGFYRMQVAGKMVYRFRAPGETTWTRVPGHPNEMEAKQWRNRYLGEDESVRVKPTSAKFIDVADAALVALEQNRRAESTMKGHKICLRTYLRPLHNIAIQEIDRHVLIARVVRPMEEKKLSGSTIHNAMMTTSVVFEYAIDCKPRLVSDNPVRRVKTGEARPSRKTKKKKVILSQAQLATLLDNSKGTHRLIFATLALTGLRISECLNLEWSMIDFENRLIWPDGTKTEASKGSVQLSKKLASMLAAHKLASYSGHDTDYVFVSSTGRRFDRFNVAHRLNETCARAQKTDPTFPSFSPHHLRHTFVSQLLFATGGDIGLASSQARHASPAVTMAVYAHEVSMAQGDRRAADAIDASLGSGL